MTSNISHKTVFVLDHSAQFMHSSNQSTEYDIFGKGKTPGIIPAAPIYKSLWTCVVEAVMEYVRVVYDIYPVNRLVKVVSGEKVLNSWNEKEQNMQHLMNALSLIGKPSATDEYHVYDGLDKAIEELSTPTELQAKQMLARQEGEGPIENKGRIICITHAGSDTHINQLVSTLLGSIDSTNASTPSDRMDLYWSWVPGLPRKLYRPVRVISWDELKVKVFCKADNAMLSIDLCELVLVHVAPVGSNIEVSQQARQEVSPCLVYEVHTTESGKEQYNKLIELVYKHYHLASTTVSGIPMKEEQNASSSANYDVELLHPAEAHTELLKSAGSEGLIIQSKEGLPITTVTLKWCTPKSNVLDFPACSGAYRITPVDVNSRPSSCLTNFLLSGRGVMLEQPRKTGTKVVSHMLASHGGEIFIHCIPTARSVLEDPPSISEGLGGRVTDYRIPDFREFMKDNRLAPSSPAVAELSPQLPLTRAIQHIERMSRCWPMVISDTIIFNMASHIDPLPVIIVKERITEEEVLECKKAIFHVVGMETRNDPLPINVTGTRGKGSKREQQYAHMWSELESFIRAHADTSPMHQKILECLLECKKTSPEDSKLKKSEKPEISEAESAWKDLDRYEKMTEHEKKEFNRLDSSDESGIPSKRLRPGFTEPIIKSGGKQNLLSMWTNRIKSVHSKRHVEFIGRQENQGTIAQLYKDMFKEDEEGMLDLPTQKKKP